MPYFDEPVGRDEIQTKIFLKLFIIQLAKLLCPCGRISNRSSGVQISRDICTCFGRYSNSTKCSWIINTFTVLGEEVTPALAHAGPLFWSNWKKTLGARRYPTKNLTLKIGPGLDPGGSSDKCSDSETQGV